MSERIEKVKAHLKENKVTYFVSVGSAMVGAALAVVMIGRSEAGTEIAQKITQIGFGNRVNAAIINFIENSTPSKPVHLVGTDRYFSSLNEAARKTGHNLSRISKNVNGHIPDVGGDIFEFVDLAA